MQESVGDVMEPIFEQSENHGRDLGRLIAAMFKGMVENGLSSQEAQHIVGQYAFGLSSNMVADDNPSP